MSKNAVRSRPQYDLTRGATIRFSTPVSMPTSTLVSFKKFCDEEVASCEKPVLTSLYDPNVSRFLTVTACVGPKFSSCLRMHAMGQSCTKFSALSSWLFRSHFLWEFRATFSNA